MNDCRPLSLSGRCAELFVSTYRINSFSNGEGRGGQWRFALLVLFGVCASVLRDVVRKRKREAESDSE